MLKINILNIISKIIKDRAYLCNDDIYVCNDDITLLLQIFGFFKEYKYWLKYLEELLIIDKNVIFHFM